MKNVMQIKMRELNTKMFDLQNDLQNSTTDRERDYIRSIMTTVDRERFAVGYAYLRNR